MSEYQNCMTKAMRAFPKGISREERGRLFCIEAKICSGKFSDRAAAERDCIENPPKPRAPKGKRGQACLNQIGTVIDCLLSKNITSNPETVLRTHLPECMCGKTKMTRAQKAQAMWDSMPAEQKEALQAIELMKKEYGTE